MQTCSLDDVFGINRELPLNYVERKNADTVLVDNLSRKQHLIIYGSSKQGKTSLRKHCLKPDDYVTVHCSNKWSLEQLHTSILKQAGFELTKMTSTAISGAAKIHAKLGLKLFGAEMNAEGKKDVESVRTPLELDPLDTNDIITALEGIRFERYIILEDFHYLPTETQKDFAVALKAFHENSNLSFIIIGVWLEENRLTVYNGDLTGRLLPINADRWERDELEQVIHAGEELLNITFVKGFIRELLDSCHGSVYIVQDSCRQACLDAGIHRTLKERREIGTSDECTAIVSAVVNRQSGRFNAFLTQFSAGFQGTELEMHKWLLYAVLTADPEKLSDGLQQGAIRKLLKKVHPRGTELNPGNVTQSLQSVTSLQLKKGIKPIILDYDQTSLRLSIVDKSFEIWLSRQDRNELLDLVGLPLV